MDQTLYESGWKVQSGKSNIWLIKGKYKTKQWEEDLLPAVLPGKGTKFRTEYVGLKSRSRGGVGREEVDIRVEEKQ
jgi:hypothetical protein